MQGTQCALQHAKPPNTEAHRYRVVDYLMWVPTTIDPGGTFAAYSSAASAASPGSGRSSGLPIMPKFGASSPRNLLQATSTAQPYVKPA